MEEIEVVRAGEEDARREKLMKRIMLWAGVIAVAIVTSIGPTQALGSKTDPTIGIIALITILVWFFTPLVIYRNEDAID